jgi:hypothetical protein
MVILGNCAQIKRVTRLIDESRQWGRFCLYIDEVDLVDSGGDNVKTAEALESLKFMAAATFGVTATVADTIMKESTITHANYINIQPAAIYKGISELEWVELEPLVSSPGKVACFDDLATRDPNIKPFLEEFATRQPHAKRVPQSSIVASVPQICLMNVTFKVNNMRIIEDYIARELPQIATIVYNGLGTRVRIDKEITENKQSISETLQEIKDNHPRSHEFSLLLADWPAEVLALSARTMANILALAASKRAWDGGVRACTLSAPTLPNSQTSCKTCGCVEMQLTGCHQLSTLRPG